MARSRNIVSKSLAAREGARAPVTTRAPMRARSTRFSADAFDGGRPVGFWRLMARPSGLFCVSLFCFLIVSGVKMWESGLFDPMIGPRGAGPIEAGPIRFAPQERAAAKAYVAEPEPEPASERDESEDENGDTP